MAVEPFTKKALSSSRDIWQRILDLKGSKDCQTAMSVEHSQPWQERTKAQWTVVWAVLVKGNEGLMRRSFAILLAGALLAAGCAQPTRTIEGQRAVEIALNDPSVKEQISGQGYEVGEVRQLEPDEPGDFVVTIHPGKRELPGIYLNLVVDVEQQKVLVINRHLRPRQLAEEEKAEALRIALSDSKVLERIGDKEYEVTRIEEFGWSEGDEFFVFPAVELNIPPDRRFEGLVLWVCVDLEAKEVVGIISKPRKSLPPDIPKRTGQ